MPEIAPRDRTVYWGASRETTAREDHMGLTVGILGYGSFGAFLHRMAERFLPQADVRAHTRSRAPGEGIFTTLEDAVASDILFLSVPISAYETMLERIKPILPKSTILVDVATVKVHTGEAIRRVLPDQPYVSTHPMFGPESYTKQGGDVTGLRIVATDSNLPEGTLPPIWERLRAEGFDVVETSADKHDKDLAETLFLTHYVAQVIHHGGFERTDIDTVSFGYLMDAVDAVRHDTQLFGEVFRFNPYCADLVRRFDRSERAVRAEILKLVDET
jgi:prephenate dehydrogenase